MYTILEEPGLQKIAVAKIDDLSNNERTIVTVLSLIPLKMELKTSSQSSAFITHSAPSKKLIEYIYNNPYRTYFFNIGNVYQKNNRQFIEILKEEHLNNFVLNISFIVPVEDCIFHVFCYEKHYILEGKNKDDMLRLFQDKDFFTFCENSE